MPSWWSLPSTVGYGDTFQPASLSREFDDGWRVGQGASVIDHRAVDQGHSTPGRFPAIAAVNMPEDMEPGLDPEYGPEQVLTASVFGHDVRFVERAVGRLVGDEHIRVVRDEIPVLADLDQPLPCKSPISADRVDRRSPEVHPFEGDSGILKVDGFGQVSAGQFRFAVEEQIVIAGDDQLVPEGKGTEPGIEVVDLLNRVSVEVAGRQSQLAMEAWVSPMQTRRRGFFLASAWLAGSVLFGIALGGELRKIPDFHGKELVGRASGNLFGMGLDTPVLAARDEPGSIVPFVVGPDVGSRSEWSSLGQ